MGHCFSCSRSAARSPHLIKQFKDSKNIDRQLKVAQQELRREVKILLLGAGESGKTTVLKQMQIVNDCGSLTESRKEEYRQQVFKNLCESMNLCLEIMHAEDIRFEDETLLACRSMFDCPTLEPGQPFPHVYHQVLARLWTDRGVRTAMNNRTKWAIPENMYYFFADLDRLFSPQYTPTDQDILHCRGKSQGISEISFTLCDVKYRLFDVGGQRSERKKWIHCFEGVTAILFVAAMSGYDLPLLEAKESNQMQEALILFDTIINSRWFTNTSIILFLNKSDILKQKITYSPVSHFFADFRGNNTNYEDVRTYFKNKFLRLDHSSMKPIYTHYTCATDTSSMKIVLASVTSVLLTQNMGGVL